MYSVLYFYIDKYIVAIALIQATIWCHFENKVLRKCIFEKKYRQ